MSVIRCEGCEMYIDTDFNPAAYNEDLDIWLCEACEEAHEAETEDPRRA